VARSGRARQVVRILTEQPRTPTPTRKGLRLSWRGRLVAAIFLVPGVSAAMLSLYLPNSDQGGVFSLSALTFYLGGLVVLTGPACAVLHAHGLPALRRDPDDASWRAWRRDHVRGLPVVAGLALAAADLAAAGWFAVLSNHAGVELATAYLFGLAATVHVSLVVSAARRSAASAGPSASPVS
jgi:hypothetical protein